MIMISSQLFRQAYKAGRSRGAVAVAFDKRSAAFLSSCPVTDTTGTTDASKVGEPQLTIVPSLPFVGSTIPQHSGTLPMGDGKDFTFWPGMRDKFGDFYRLGLPGFGVGTHGLAHVLTCPNEMSKVIRAEGKYPSGVLQIQWALLKVLKESDSAITRGEQDGYFGRGTHWKRQRTFIQTDLLHPKAADGYIPGVIRAAELASKGASDMSSKLNYYLNHCAFDMFSTIMFGQMMESADPNTPTDVENERFVDAAKTQLQLNNSLNKEPYELVMGKLFGIKTKNYKTLEQATKVMFELGGNKIRKFVEKKRNGQLSELEQNSWLAHAVERQAADDSDITDEELVALAGVLLGAAVDTTSSLIAWNLLHLGLNADVQQRLYEEVATAVEANNGRLSADALSKKQVPYLHAFIRESFRLTPAAPLNSFKKVSNEIEIHGQTFPEGTFFVFEGYSTGQRAFQNEEPQAFRPERWLPEAVAARKGTPQQIVDHAFLKEPFSQGARKCPGSRVATNETQVLLAQLILDWKISVPGVNSHTEVPYALMGANAPILPEMEFVPRS